MVNKRVRNAVLGCNLKNDRMISVRFQGKPFDITVIQVYALTSNAEEVEVEHFHKDLQHLLELTPKKDVLFIIGLFPTPWTAAYQAPPSMGFVRQEYWSGVPLPSLVIIGHRNAKVGSHEPLGVTGKFGLGV